MAIKFGELKKYLSRVTRLSICFTSGHYDNYLLVSDIPEGKYDDMYVYGVGMIDVEFPLDEYSTPKEFSQPLSFKDGLFMGAAIEVVVQDEPRDIERINNNELTFGDLRDYLQIGRNFTIVRKEDWTEEHYEWRRDIPEEYDSMYVYGIGMEDNSEGLMRIIRMGFMDSFMAKNMKIVVSESPRE